MAGTQDTTLSTVTAFQTSSVQHEPSAPLASWRHTHHLSVDCLGYGWTCNFSTTTASVHAR